jgi:hypothetical protein
MQLLQVFAILFALFALSRVILRAKEGKLTLREFMLWFLIWVAFIVIAFFPNVSTFFANIIGFGRGMDLLIFASVGLLFYMVFRIYVKLEDQEREISDVVRAIAVKKENVKKSKNSDLKIERKRK